MNIHSELRKHADAKKAKLLQGFFKTGKGEYGEGDIFLGLTVPVTRSIAHRFLQLSPKDIQRLLDSKIHEERLAGLMVLVEQYKKADRREREKIYRFYLKNAKKVNNWDLVDLSSHRIAGQHLLDKEKTVLYKLAESKNLWERRIAIVSTAWFIANGRYSDTLRISEILLHDKHDLIQKATGWMLREVGKKDESVLKRFLKKHYKEMPRTMLRYSIEKFPKPVQQRYIHGTI